MSIIIYCLLLLVGGAHARPLPTYTIMLDPAGDARQAGRILDDTVERAASLACVSELQEAIESYIPNSTVIITRTAGQLLQPFQNASFANRLTVDLYIHVALVHEQEEKPTLYIYRYAHENSFAQTPNSLAMIPYDQAYRSSASRSQTYAETISSICTQKSNASLYRTKGPYLLPCTPLLGIQPPALMLEIGIAQKNDWRNVIQSVGQAIATCMESHS